MKVAAGSYFLIATDKPSGRSSKKIEVEVKTGDSVFVRLHFGEELEEVSIRKVDKKERKATTFKRHTEGEAMTAAPIMNLGYFDDGYGGSEALTVDGSGATAGTLTAGELRDFSKWNLWQTLTEEGLGVHADLWQMRPEKRVSVWVTNQEELAVINARVTLINNDKAVWSTYTDNTGRAELWMDFMDELGLQLDRLHLQVEADGQTFRVENLVSIETGTNHVVLNTQCHTPYALDIAFVVDATGSMSDEIYYLQAELEDVINHIKSENEQVTVNLGSVFYRDVTDDYVTRSSPFSTNIDETAQFVKAQGAKGGGDFPEAVDSALAHAVNGLRWSTQARAKLLFLVLDAPPHSDSATVARMKRITQKAARQGIRIIPIVGSGIDKPTEYLMRSLALATNGTYVFLTDHSGVGNAHLEPDTDEYEVKKLNELLKEIISRYTVVSECGTVENAAKEAVTVDHEVVDATKQGIVDDEPVLVKNKVLASDGQVVDGVLPSNLSNPNEVVLFPNPADAFVNILFNQEVTEFQLLDLHGRFLRRYTGNGLTTQKLNLSEFAAGTYFIAYDDNGKAKMEQLIIAR